MKKIKYIVPYFGKLPQNFQLWLLSCSKNPTINWLVFTNDKTEFDYPKNVEVVYCTFEDIKERIQQIYEFKIVLDRPWKLCDYKVAYGEIFAPELVGFDFWGYCDIDLMFGNIRNFITDEILDKYEKIGFQGHSTLYKNVPDVNQRYRSKFEQLPNYIEIFTNSKGYCFDENIIGEIYDNLKIPYYKETNFAHLSKYDYSFFLRYLPKEDNYKNNRQIFVWKNGVLRRFYLDKEKEIKDEEYMYLHFFCRPIKYNISSYSDEACYVIYPDIVENLKCEINNKYIENKGTKSKLKYYVESIWYNRRKLTPRRIYGNISRMIRYKITKK